MTLFLTYSLADRFVEGPNGDELWPASVFGARFADTFESAVAWLNSRLDLTILEVPASGTTFGVDTAGDIAVHGGRIDGPNRVLAQTVIFGGGPTAIGDQIYDIADGLWWINPDTAFHVMLHELVHSIGHLNGNGGHHSGNPNHLMWPGISYRNPKDGLASDELVRYAETLGYGYDPENHVKIDGYEGQIYGLYELVLGRPPDNAGFVHHAKKLTGWQTPQLTIEDLYSALMTSVEAEARFGRFDNEDFVEELYMQALKRPAAPDEVSEWVKRLETGEADRADVAADIGLSVEYVFSLHTAFEQHMWYEVA
ncbi:MAG: DUF4214 domain-containing protein [Roseibium sp.]|nr:DUF4214 domain-containing protein [Roseibium sp.]